jgi:hypothetical protein
MFHVEHSPEGPFARHSRPPGPPRVEPVHTTQLDEAGPAGLRSPRLAEPELAESFCRPPILAGIWRFAHHEAPIGPKETHRTLRRDGGRPESSGNDETVGLAVFRFACDKLGPPLDHRDPGREAETVRGAHEELAPAVHCIEQHDPLLGPGLGQDQARHPTTGAEIQHRTAKGAHELRHGERVTDVLDDGPGPQEPQRSRLLEHPDQASARCFRSRILSRHGGVGEAGRST